MCLEVTTCNHIVRRGFTKYAKSNPSLLLNLPQNSPRPKLKRTIYLPPYDRQCCKIIAHTNLPLQGLFKILEVQKLVNALFYLFYMKYCVDASHEAVDKSPHLISEVFFYPVQIFLKVG